MLCFGVITKIEIKIELSYQEKNKNNGETNAYSFVFRRFSSISLTNWN